MDPEKIKLYLSEAGFLLSIIALLISLRTSRLSAMAARRPVLVFIYDSVKGWRVRNLGKGPALNVLIAQKKIGEKWFNPIRIPPLSDGDEFELMWCRHVNDTGLGAACTDVSGKTYSSSCGNDLTSTQEGSLLPEWSEKEIGKHWHHLKTNAGGAPQPLES